MKISRDLGGQELAKLLNRYGYIITRQTGSHIRLSTEYEGGHHITIPAHKPLKIGTLSAILNDIANHLKKNKKLLLEELFK